MPNMCRKKIRRIKVISKPSAEAMKLKEYKEKTNKRIAIVRAKYSQLDEEYRALMELQASLMVKKYKIDAKAPLAFKTPIPKKSSVKKSPKGLLANQENKEVINKTKLNLKTGVFSSVDKDEEEEDEDST